MLLQRRHQQCTPVGRQPRSAAALPRASSSGRRARLTCLARRTQSGGGDRDAKRSSGNATRTATKPASSSPNTSPSKSSSSSRPNVTSSSSSASNSNGNGNGNGRRGDKPQPSRIEDFLRSTPGLNRFLDGTLILGDAVMVIATEVSSERLPLEQLPVLAAVATGSWVLAAAIMGDYAMVPDPDENPLSNALGWPVFAAVVDAMITWAVSMVVAIIGFSWLVSHYIVEPQLVLEVARDGMLSPQLEISVALLITMACWRGMAARLRL